MQELLKQYEHDILQVFQHLHAHPEISWAEFETTNYLKGILEEQGCRIRMMPRGTGIVGEIGSGAPVIALRADIDALWQEVNGQFQANHSCGHDAHMAMVVGVLWVLNNMEQRPKGTIRFIFQPAEETGTGALHFVDEGVVDDVDYLYGVHLRPIQELPLGKASPVIVHGAARLMSGTIIGEDLHGARPHLGANAIEVGAQLVQMLQGIHLNSLTPYTAKLTSFHAGGKSKNIIPGNATFSMDLRAQTNEAMDLLVDKVMASIAALQSLHGVKIDIDMGSHIAAAIVNEAATEQMRLAIEAVLGPENTAGPLITTGGDDFHFYTIRRPHLKATMLGLGCDLQPGLHHPQMAFDLRALILGTEILVTAVLKTLEMESREGHVSN